MANQTVGAGDTAGMDRSDRDGSYVDWACALAGAVMAAAISVVLFTFGSGIGLSLVSPWTGSAVSLLTFAVITAVWSVAVQVGSFAIGGYITGRMRRPWRDATAAEIELRDGVHGGLAWALGVVIGAMIVANAVGGAARTAAISGTGAAAVAANTSTTNDVVGSAVDTLFRSTKPQNSQNYDFRAEAVRLVSASLARGELNAADRAYLAQVVSVRTGLSQAEAEQRITEVVTTAKTATDRARKAGIVAAFLAAASLLSGLAAAWSAARIGGSHRDQGIIWRGFSRGGAWPSGVAHQ